MQGGGEVEQQAESPGVEGWWHWGSCSVCEKDAQVLGSGVEGGADARRGVERVCCDSSSTEGWHLPCRQAELVVRQGLADGRIAALRIDGLLVALTTDIGRVGGHMLSSGGLQSWQLAAVTSSCTLSAGLVQAAWNTYRSQGQAGPGCLLQLPTVCGFVLCVQVWSD